MYFMLWGIDSHFHSGTTGQATKTTSDTRTKSAGRSHPLQAGLGGGEFF